MAASRKSRRLGPPLAKSLKPYQFPPGGDYEIFSRPDFFVEIGDRGELLHCEARLVIRTSDAVVNKKGIRQVDFKVLEWEATGTSRLLGGAEVKFTVIKSLQCSVTAGSEKADLPGKMAVSLRSATYVNGVKVDEHPSKASGMISSFPPAKGDLFQISSPEKTHDLAALTKGALTGHLQIHPISCACAS
jgi:hypothetical protein